MVHPILDDPDVSTPMFLIRDDGSSEEVNGVVESSELNDDATHLEAPEELSIQVSDNGSPDGTFGMVDVEFVSIPSLGINRFKVANRRPSGSNLGSIAIGWRSVKMTITP